MKDQGSTEIGVFEKAFFRAFGFVVLRKYFQPDPLAKELDWVLQDSSPPSLEDSYNKVARFQYAPMMTADTPESLCLLDRAEKVAEGLLGHPVLPTRAKGVLYQGETSWHADSNLPVLSVGFAAYLEPLNAENGALRVIPGSHLAPFSKEIQPLLEFERPVQDMPALSISTEPGDLIVFDEHLLHSSSGGTRRRQWRADFVIDPTSPESEVITRSYFSAIYPHNWDGGYDVDRHPSYGSDWRNSRRSSVSRLEALGVYDLANRQESFMRSIRRASGRPG